MKPSKMKAAVYYQYGGPEVVQIKEVAKPAPQPHEVLIKIHAAALNSADVRLRKADPFLVRLVFGLFKPKNPILGVDFAGEIEAVGKQVTKYKVGDAVFGSTLEENLGAHAAYKCMPEDGLMGRIPKNSSFEEAASIYFGGNSSLHFLRAAGIGKGQKVLIYGASGALGVWAVQLANYFGAEVYGVCSGRNAAMVKSLGAHHIFDYTKEDFTKSGIQFDIIFDTIGKSPFTKSLHSLAPNGRYPRAVHMKLGLVLRGVLTGLTTKKKVIGGVAKETKENLEFLKDMVEREILKPVVDVAYPLDQIEDAHRYVDSGRKRGSVVLLPN